MDGSREERWDRFDQIYRRRLETLAHRLTADPDLARQLTTAVLDAAHAYADDPTVRQPGWRWLKDQLIRRVVLHEKDRLAPPGLRALLGVDDVEQENAVADALRRLGPGEADALRLRYGGRYDEDEAAGLLGLDPAGFRRLLARARHRLAEEYRRALDGLAAALGVLGSSVAAARRRLRGTLQRAHGAWNDAVVQLVTLDPVRAVAGTTAAGFTVVAFVAGGGAILGGTAGDHWPTGPARDDPMELAADVGPIGGHRAQAGEQAASSPDGVSAPSAALPVASPPATPPSAASVPPVVTVQRSVAPRPEGGTKTTFRVDATDPVTPPPYGLITPPGTEPTAPTVPSTPEPTDPTDEPGSYSLEFECPPPDARPPPLAVACPVMESAGASS